MKIALFLGAGASIPYGMPTTEKLKGAIDRRNFPRKDLLDSRRFPDIEHVLSALDQLINFAQSGAGELYASFDADESEDEGYGAPGHGRAEHEASGHDEDERDEGKFKSYVTRSRDSKEIIEQLITRHYRWDPSHDGRAGKILRALFDLAKSKDGDVTVFTTNYDTVIEEYCGNSDRRIERIDGFKFHAAMRAVVWDGKFVPRDADARTRVFLYKLHGSMNWLAGRAAGHPMVLQKPDTGPSDDRARDMYIRPSLDTKGEATRREPYAAILRQFARLLPTFDACIVIGYSFRDPHISERLVKFAKAGGALVVLSPTAEDDFRSNALDEGSTSSEGGWNRDRPRRIKLESNGKQWYVHILSEKLDEDDVDRTVTRIRSAISGDPPDGRADEGATVEI